MKHEQLTLLHYTIPFRKPFRTAAGDIVERKGFLIGDGHGIWSETAPLPGFSTESYDDAKSFLVEHGQSIRSAFRDRSLDRFLEDDRLKPELSRLPSVRFGLSMLSEQQKAIAARQPLYTYWKNLLFPKPSRNRVVPVEGYVRCNALAGVMDDEKRHQVIRFRKECGFRTVKLKVPADPDEALEMIRNTCRTYPDLVFRFDANKSFTIDQALKLFGGLQSIWEKEELPRNIAYIEEPLADPSPEALSQLRSYGFPLALDESVRTPEDIRLLESHASVTQLVIKPMLFGTFAELQAPLRSKLAVAISSTFETAIGRRLLAHLAAVSNVKRETDHGLDTGSQLQVDFPPRESGPHIHLGENAGLGLQPDIRKKWLAPVKDF